MAAFPGPDGVTYDNVNSGTASRGDITVTANSVINYTTEGNTGSSITATGRDIKLMTLTDPNNAGSYARRQMTLNGPITANSVWFAQSRYLMTANQLTNAGTIYVAGGQLWIDGAQTLNNNFHLGDSSLFTEANEYGGAALRITGNTTFAGTVNILSDGSKITVANGNTLTVNNAITGSGTWQIAAPGATGTVKLNATNHAGFTGNILVSGSAALTWGNGNTGAAAAGATCGLGNTIEIQNGGRMNLHLWTAAQSNKAQTVAISSHVKMSGTSMLHFEDGSYTFNQGIEFAAGSNATLNSQWAKHYYLTKLDGAGTIILNRGAGDLAGVNNFYLDAAGSFTGTIRLTTNNTNVNVSRLVLQHNEAASNAVIDMAQNTALWIGTTNATIAGLSGVGNVLNGTAGNTLTINNTGDYVYGGNIAADVNIVKSGTGSQTLSGTNPDFNGNITVNGGTLVLSMSGTHTLANVAVNNQASIAFANGAFTATASSMNMANLGLSDSTSLNLTGNQNFSSVVVGNGMNRLVLTGATEARFGDVSGTGILMVSVDDLNVAKLYADSLTGAKLYLTDGTRTGVATRQASGELAFMALPELTGATVNDPTHEYIRVGGNVTLQKDLVIGGLILQDVAGDANRLTVTDTFTVNDNLLYSGSTANGFSIAGGNMIVDGSLTLTGGTLKVATGATLTLNGGVMQSGGQLMLDGGTLALNQAAYGTWNVTGNGSLNVNQDASLTTAGLGTILYTVNQGGTMTLSSVTGTTTQVILNSGGRLVLAGGVNLYTGPTQLNAGGTIELQANAALTMHGAAVASRINMLGAGTLRVWGGNQGVVSGDVSAAGAVSLFSESVDASTSSLSIVSDVFNAAGTVTVNAGNGSSVRFAGRSVTMGSLALAGSNQVTFADGVNANVTGNFAFSSDTAGTVHLVNNGSLSVAGAFYVSGNMTLGAADGSERGVLTTGRFAMAVDNRASATTVNRGIVMNVTGNTNDASAGVASFMLANYPGNHSMTVSGVLNVLNAGISLRDGNGTLTINDGGIFNINSLQITRNAGTPGSVATIVLNAGAMMNVGTGGFGTSLTNLTLNGGTIGILNSTTNWTGAKDLAFAGGTTVTFNTDRYAPSATTVAGAYTGTGGTITLSGALSGAGTLVKDGVGTLVASGTSALTGNVIVRNGTLNVTGTLGTLSNLNMQGGQLTVGGTTDVSFAAYTSGAGRFGINVSANTPGVLNYTGTAALGASNTLNFNFDFANLTNAKTLTVLKSTVAGNTAATVFNTDQIVRGQNATLAWDATGTNLVLTVTGTKASANLVWNGTAGQVWDSKATEAWLNGTDASMFYAMDTVEFTAASGIKNIVLQGQLQTAGITVSGGDYTFTSATGGSTLSGNITVNAGASLTAGTAGVLGSGAIANSGTLSIGENVQYGTMSAVTGNGTLRLKEGSSASVAYADAQSYVADQNARLTLTGMGGSGNVNTNFKLAGNGNITCVYTGNPVVLTTNNAFTGTLTLSTNSTNNQWVMNQANGSQFLAPVDGKYGSIVLAATTKMTLGSAYHGKANGLLLGGLSGDASSRIEGRFNTNPSTSENYRYITLRQDTDTVFAGVFEAQNAPRDIGIIKHGSGRLTLTGANASPADLDVHEGIVAIGNGGTTGQWSGNINVYSTDDATGTLIFNRSNALTYGGALGGNGVIEIENGNITLSGTATNFTGEIKAQGGTLIAGSTGFAGTGTIVADGGTINLGTFAVTSAIRIDNSASVLTAGTGGTAAGGITISNGVTLNTRNFSQTGTIYYTSADNFWNIRGDAPAGTVVDFNGVTDFTIGDHLKVALWDGGVLTDAMVSAAASTTDLTYTLEYMTNGELWLKVGLNLANAYVWSGQTTDANQATAWTKQGITGPPTVTDSIYFTDDAFTAEGTNLLNVDTAGLSVKDILVSISADNTYNFNAGAGFTTTGSLVKNGAGTLVVGVNNHFANVELRDGTTEIRTAGALGTGTVTMSDGATLKYGANASGWEDDILSGNLTLAAGSTAAHIDISQAAGIVTWTEYLGTTAITKSGAGTLKLSQTALTTAAITATDGVLELAGATTYSGSITLNGTASALNLTGTTTFANGFTLALGDKTMTLTGTLTDRNAAVGYDATVNGGTLTFGAAASTYTGKLTMTGNATLSTDGNATLAGTIAQVAGSTLNLAGTGTFIGTLGAADVALGAGTGLQLNANATMDNLVMTDTSRLSGAHTLTLSSGDLNGTVDNATAIAMTGGTNGTGSLNLNGIDMGALTVTGGNITGATGTIGQVHINVARALTTNFGGMDAAKITSLRTTNGGARITGLTGTATLNTAFLTFGTGTASINGAGADTAKSIVTGANLTVNGAFTANLSDELVAALKTAIGNDSATVSLFATNGTLTANIGDIVFGNSMSLKVADTQIQGGNINFTARLNTVFVASVDGALTQPDAYTLATYQSLDGFTAVQMDHDMLIDLPGTAPADKTDGLVINQMYGNGEASRTATLTLQSSVAGEQTLVTLRNGTSDTTYLGNLTATDTKLVKDGTYGLGIGGNVTIGSNSLLQVKEGKLALTGAGKTNDISALQVDAHGTFAATGAQSRTTLGTLDLQGGRMEIGGNRSTLTVNGLAAGSNGSIDVADNATMILALPQASMYTGSLASSDNTGNLDIRNGSLMLAADSSIRGLSLNLAASTGLDLADGSSATVRGLQMAAGSSLTGTGDVTTTAGGTIEGDLHNYSGTLANTNGTLAINGTGGLETALTATGSGTIALNYAGGNASYRQVNIGQGGTVILNGANGNGQNNQLRIDGGSIAAGGTLGFIVNTAAAGLFPNSDSPLISNTGVLNVSDGARFSFSAASNQSIINGSMPIDITLADGVVLTGDGNYTISYDKLFSKYFDANLSTVHVKNGKLVLTTSANTRGFYVHEATTVNGRAGGALLDNMLVTVNPQATAADSNLSRLMTELDNQINQNTASGKAAANTIMAAAAGATVTTLNAAQLGTQERNMRAIRNRTVTMGIDPSVVQQDLPYWNAWASFNGANSDISQNGDQPGYKLSSWGGTIGADSDISRHITLGVAFTANYGKLTATGADTASGHVDSYLASLYLRGQSGKWSHVGILTGGTAKADLDRTVNYGAGQYKTSGTTDGSSFGAMYELAYDIALDTDYKSLVQPLFNASLNSARMKGYTETGAGNANLSVENMDTTYGTVGVGGRYIASVGQNLFNRTATLEARAMLLQDVGDRQVEADVAFADAKGYKRTVEGIKPGSTGVEVGLGLTIPVELQSSIFMEINLDARSRSTEVSGGIGYRYNF
ncbi:hypothetical protein [Akkermansia glycaniphila]|uniref:Autotransporter beta-domain n=2 Tax=Akkermansia glycaniphila TaxID=1679444 RepID=A0A1H6KCE9_9BACT|nr:hypothetical protein [Akkermansia glycaniphila]SEH69458.1 autotransporter beta-domain [Akkermansia glycaniphila]